MQGLFFDYLSFKKKEAYINFICRKTVIDRTETARNKIFERITISPLRRPLHPRLSAITALFVDAGEPRTA